MDELFERFWSVIPKRNHPHPKELSRKSFFKAVSNGAKPEEIIDAAYQWRRTVEEMGKIGTEFVPMASTWLNQARFKDFKTGPIGGEQLKREQWANERGWFFIERDGEMQWTFLGVGYDTQSGSARSMGTQSGTGRVCETVTRSDAGES